MIFVLLLVIPLASAKVYPRTGVDGASNIHDDVEGLLYEIPEYEDPDITLYRLAQRGIFPLMTVMEVAKESKGLSIDDGTKHHYEINGVRTELNDAMAQLYIAKTKLEKGDDHISMDIDKTIYFLMNLKHRLQQETDFKTGPTKESSSDAYLKNYFASGILAKQHSTSVAPNKQFLPFDASNKQYSPSDVFNKQLSLFKAFKKPLPSSETLFKSSSETPFEASSTSNAVSTIGSFDVPSEETTESFSSVEPFIALDSPSKKYVSSKLSMSKYLASEVSEQRLPDFDAAVGQSITTESDEQNLTTSPPATKYLASDASKNRYLDIDVLIQKPNKHDHHTQLSLSLGNPKMEYSFSNTAVKPVLADGVSSEKKTSDGDSSSTNPSFSTENLYVEGALHEKKAEGLYEDGIYIAGTNKYEVEENASNRKEWSWIPPEIE